jgi:pimeloyl-ACP methyl ester carboxylesterase
MCKSKKRMLWFILTLAISIALLQGNSEASERYDFDVEVTGTGIDVILIPGLSSSGDVWNETVAELKNSYRLHVVTLPGFAGKDPIDTDEEFVFQMAEQIVDYIRAGEIENPVLMGHSMGGFMSLYIATEYPDLPLKVVSVDGVPFMTAMINPRATEETGEQMAMQMTNQLRMMAGQNRRQMHQQVISTMVTDTKKQEEAVEWSMTSDLSTISHSVQALYTNDLRDDLQRVKAPILMLGSWKGYESYGITKERTEQMLKQQYSNADDVTIKVSEEGLHFLMWDDFDFMIQSFRSFMSDETLTEANQDR